MVKNLLLASAVAITAFSSLAADRVTELNWHYGTEPRTATRFGATKGYTDYAFIYVTPEVATKLAGCQVNGLHFVNGIYNALIPKVKVIFTESLSEEPFFTKTGQKVTSSSLDSTQSYISQWNTTDVDFEEPYTIKAGQGFYAGFAWDEKTSTDYPLAYDYLPAKSYTGGFLAAREESTTALADITLYDYSAYYGALGIMLKVSGDNINPQQEITVYSMSGDAAVAAPGEEFYSYVYLYNSGAQPISSISYKYTDNTGKETESTLDASTPLQFGELTYLPVSSSTDVERVINQTFEITAINGSTEGVTQFNSASAKTLVFNEEGTNGFQRNVLGEEFTGTWCGYCPRGYVGMEYMKSTYTDGSWVGYAVHAYDDMTNYDVNGSYTANDGEFDDLLDFIEGFPSALIDRGDAIDAQQDALEEGYKADLSRRAPAQIVSLTAKHDDDNIYITSDVKFAFDVDPGDFSIEYILREDNVGPYVQHNYYTGTGDTYKDTYQIGDFGNLDEYVSLNFNDVGRARKVYDDPFSSGAIANTTVTHKGTLPIPDGVKIDDTDIIAVIVGPNYYVANAKLQLEYAGVNDIAVDEAQKFAPSVNNGTLSVAESATVYTTAGQRVASLKANGSVNLPAGIYIVRAANQVAKVIVK